MTLTTRLFETATDFANMRALLGEGLLANTSWHYPHPGDLNWWTHNPPDADIWRASLRLCESGDRLLAWSRILSDGDEVELDLYVHPSIFGKPEHSRLFDEAMLTAREAAQTTGAKRISLGGTDVQDTVTVQLAKAAGFTVFEIGHVHLTRSLDDALATPAVPQGFSIRDARSEDGFLARIQALHGAFGPDRPWDAYWAKAQRFYASDVFVREDNLAIAAPDGRGAAGCTIWLDPVSGVGLFEPVGTHPDFQRRGLGKALMLEGLRRMRAGGMRKAIVSTGHDNTGAIALYQSVGMTVVRRITFPVCEVRLQSKAQ